jgi:hypothetical protein
MVGAVFFTFVPTAFAYVLIARTRLVKDDLFALAVSWFLGQYVATWIVFVLAVALAAVTDRVLLKAAIATVDFLIVVALLVFRAELVAWARASLRPERLRALLSSTSMLALTCLAFAFLVFRPHLAHSNGVIFRSEVYWDFVIHYPMIQTFVYGDNFPPQNDSFSGVPMTYHYFFDLLTAIYAAFGLDLVGAMQYVSIMTLCIMLLAVIGFATELFGSQAIGVLAALLCVTTGSLRFASTIAEWGGVINAIPLLLTNTIHPYRFAFVSDNAFGYNGNMWNIFYLIAERQMIMGIIFLLFSAWAFWIIDRVPKWAAVVIGALMGLFLQWHLYITIMVLCAAMWVAVLHKPARGLLLFLLVGFIPVFFAQILYLKSLLNDAWFLPAIHDYPRLSFEFPTMGDRYPYSFQNALGYYAYAYGLKLLFLAIAAGLLWRNRSPGLIVLSGIIVPTFVLINTIQLSPLSVYDNHKWLRPMNVVVDLAVAYAVVRTLFRRGPPLAVAGGVPVIVLLSLSGFMELMPFLNSRPSVNFALYPTQAIATVRAQSEPRDTFLSPEAKELHLAGRKLYLGNSADEPGATSILETEKFNVKPREEAVAAIYASENAPQFCARTEENGIDMIEFNNATRSLPLFQDLTGFPRFEIRNEPGQLLVFVNARQGCGR